MEKQLTALAQSIARKKDRVIKLRYQFGTVSFARMEADLLNREITEDEKLLAVDEEHIIKAHGAGQAFAVGSHRDFKQTHPDAKDYYNATFKND